MITIEQLSEFVRKGKNAQSEINKLCRTNDPQTSKDAAQRMVESGKLSRQEQQVYNTISKYMRYAPVLYGLKDFTTKDIASWMTSLTYDKAYDICRRRFSGLQDKGKIEPIVREGILTITGRTVYERRDGCRVWRLL